MFDFLESPLVDAGQWVQWAEASVTSNQIEWAQKNADTRYNLGQFWQLKKDHYQEDPIAWDRMDLRAMKAWAALAELGMVADNPPAQARYQQEAQQAYRGAIETAARIGEPVEALQRNAAAAGVWFEVAKTHGVDDSMSAAVKQRADELVSGASFLLDIPIWAWAAGAAGLFFLIYGRK